MIELIALIALQVKGRGYMVPGEKPVLDIARYKLPVLGGQREIIMGPLPIPTQYEGYFINKVVAGPRGNADLPPNPVNWIENRVGYMSWSVAPYPFQNKQALLVQTDGTYKQVLKDAYYGTLNLVNKMKRSFWIGPDGKLLQENTVIELASGVWSMQAIFNKDGYEVYLRNPYKGEKKSTINVPFDESWFDAMFAPKVRDGKMILQEKEFYE